MTLIKMFALLVVGYSLSTIAVSHMACIDADRENLKREGTHIASSPASERSVPRTGAGVYDATSREQPETPSRRFPRYGTTQFSRSCNWTSTQRSLSAGEISKGCTLLVRPIPSSKEGLAHWTAEVSAGYLYHLQTGCRLLIDYGQDIDLERILTPPEGSRLDWRVPERFSCDERERCGRVFLNWTDVDLCRVAKALGTAEKETPLVPAPQYRCAYKSFSKLSKPGILRLQRALPGFQVDSGMACAFGSLFQLASSASQFEPNLHSMILPALRDEKSLVIAIYIRTGRTDKAYRLEKEGQVIEEDTTALVGNHQSVINCALKLEEENLSMNATQYSRVVWMLVTDSPNLKNLVESSYKGHSTGSVSREVLTTSSRGVQTRPERSPSTSDFAEGFIDWFLLGESDFVVAGGGMSFGDTGAQRTSRPLYDGIRCQSREMIVRKK